MENESLVNYTFVLKQYRQHDKDRSMKKFSEDEGYDYDKSLAIPRKVRMGSASSRKLMKVRQ